MLQVRDDRFVLRRIHRSAVARLLRAGPGGSRRLNPLRWVAPLRHAPRAGVVIAVAAAVLVGFAVALMIVEGPTGLWLVLFSPVFTTLLFVGLLGLVWLAAVVARLAQASARAALSARRCPACGYDLAAAEPEPADRCVVCPECAAAWSADRLGRQAEPPPRIVVIPDAPSPANEKPPP